MAYGNRNALVHGSKWFHAIAMAGLSLRYLLEQAWIEPQGAYWSRLVTGSAGNGSVGALGKSI